MMSYAKSYVVLCCSMLSHSIYSHPTLPHPSLAYPILHQTVLLPDIARMARVRHAPCACAKDKGGNVEKLLEKIKVNPEEARPAAALTAPPSP